MNNESSLSDNSPIQPTEKKPPMKGGGGPACVVVLLGAVGGGFLGSWAGRQLFILLDMWRAKHGGPGHHGKEDWFVPIEYIAFVVGGALVGVFVGGLFAGLLLSRRK